MRYLKDQKDNTRRRILDVAARRFRGEGVAAAGVAALMQDAGLTNGAFYVHFKSKQHLVEEVLVDAMDRRLAKIKQGYAAGVGTEQAIRDYLSPLERDATTMGCPTAALVGEIAHHSATLRGLFTGRLAEFLDLMASHLPSGRRGDATALFGLMVGTLQLARAVAVADPVLSQQILDNGIAAALTLYRQAAAAGPAAAPPERKQHG